MPIPILMPALSPTMTEGKLARWLKKEGDAVAAGDVLAEIETDKVTMEIEAVDEGTLAKILVPDDTEGVPVKQVIAVLVEEGEDPADADAVVTAPPPKPVAAPPPKPAEPGAPGGVETAVVDAGAFAVASQASSERVFASPLARRVADQSSIELASIKGSGPRGRIVKRDVDAAIAGGGAAPAPITPGDAEFASGAAAPVPPVVAGAAYTEVPNSTMRKVIARRLSESKRDIPHYYLSVDCELDALLGLRADLNARSPEGEDAYKISVNDFIVRAIALALKRVPEANASWTDDAVRLFSAIDVAVAVATPGGLITPIIRGADTKGLATISGEMRDLAARARVGKLAPDEYQGGGFTLSNLGMYGIKEFAAVINPPQSCILAVGMGEQRPVVKDGALAIATVMSCTLSADHRSVDGAIGAGFLAAFKDLIEEPLKMPL
ncbi:MAG: pyruvate dehydrogenase complex dihydrolipoamide acetyltransferase [Rhodospirillales bacterium]|jgi:pyruvate dehydrogenase E2 component (dihydrolipoamide acetyltransferase)|nr:pyruvate dehydrogenase complex dihydrolipoamide acetyltransferase [Rhodospirillales bacterium]